MEGQNFRVAAQSRNTIHEIRVEDGVRTNCDKKPPSVPIPEFTGNLMWTYQVALG